LGVQDLSVILVSGNPLAAVVGMDEGCSRLGVGTNGLTGAKVSVEAAVLLGSGVVAALMFLVLASVAATGQPVPLDHAIAEWARRLESPLTDRAMRVLTFAGSLPAVASFITAVVLWTARSGRWRLAVLLAGTVSLAEGLNVLLKLLFQRARPAIAFAIPIPASYSFPSGHAMVSVAAYGLAAMIIVRLRPQLTACLIAVTPVWIVLIGFSRIYLGVHWATDVLAGFAAGTLLLLPARIAAAKVETGQDR
jgi:undecaprenyl-diphosphatase